LKIRYADPPHRTGRFTVDGFAAMPLAILFVVALPIIVWLLREPLFTQWRRAAVRRRPFPPQWRQILRRSVPYFRSLPADLQLQLKKHIQVFVAEKAFVGCGGLAVTDEMRVTVAAQACLLILNRRTDYFGDFGSILLYPNAFVVDSENTDEAGVRHQRQRVLAGQSWSMGQVILSWEDVAAGAAIADDGRNVVIHEFAHRLDQQDGAANGAPRMFGRARRERWARVMGTEFAALQRQVGDRQATLLDPYGASDPAEFFAVASEVFFEQARLLKTHHAELYGVLASYYRVDPLTW
jgi:Mlc titration factor MtfA (ptsG expression regulator)